MHSTVLPAILVYVGLPLVNVVLYAGLGAAGNCATLHGVWSEYSVTVACQRRVPMVIQQ